MGQTPKVPVTGKERLKVLFLPSWYPSSERPIDGIFIQDQAKVISTKHDVAVLIPGVSSIYGLWNRRRRERNSIEQFDGILTARYFAQSWVPRSYRASLHTLRRAAVRGFEKLVETWGRADVIHAHVVLPCGWIAAALSRRYGIPMVLTEHSSPFSMHLRKSWMRSWVRSTLDSCRAVVALSPSLAADMEGISPGTSIEVIGEVVSDVPLNGGSAERSRTNGPIKIAFVGGLREQKGVEYLLRALGQIVRAGVDADLELAGEGPLRPELEELSKSLGIADRCRFLGALPRSEVFDLLHRSDLLVVSSLHETHCVAAAEAMACGKPVVVTKCGGPEHFVTPDIGRVVDPANADSLAAGILDVASRLDSYDGTAIRRSIIGRFGSGAFLERIESVYRSVVPSSPSEKVA